MRVCAALFSALASLESMGGSGSFGAGMRRSSAVAGGLKDGMLTLYATATRSPKACSTASVTSASLTRPSPSPASAV